MTATHIALIVTHAAYVVGAVILVRELVAVRRSAWRLVGELRREARRRGPRLRRDPTR